VLFSRSIPHLTRSCVLGHTHIGHVLTDTHTHTHKEKKIQEWKECQLCEGSEEERILALSLSLSFSLSLFHPPPAFLESLYFALRPGEVVIISQAGHLSPPSILVFAACNFSICFGPCANVWNQEAGK